MITSWALQKVPTSFFSPPRLMPVLPPAEASTIASRVVGTLMKRMPRLNVEAAIPPRSVTMPPPTFMSSEWRVAPCRLRCVHTWVSDSMFLFVSPALMVITSGLCAVIAPLRRGRQNRSVVSSAKTNRRSYCAADSASMRALPASWVKTMRCSSIRVQSYK